MSAIARALLRYVDRQPTAWAGEPLFPLIEREIADGRVWGKQQEDSKPMRTEAAGAGFYDSPWGTTHPRIQIRTIAELLAGKGIDRPPHQGNVTFKKAPRVQTKKGEQPQLL
jgi:site-specific DNA-methyltransferase (adenine-specific)